jgi:FkbM family methyltransferase
MKGLYQKLPDKAKEKILEIKYATLNPQMKKFYSQFIKPGDLVFDIGANVGNYTKIYLKLGAKVVAVEPQPYCQKVLRQRFKNNTNAIPINKAISDKQGIAKLAICSNNHALSTLSKKWAEKGPYSDAKWDQTIEIQTTSLDMLIDKYGMPKFCKIDVEGYEHTVLKGLTQPIEFISFEFSNNLLPETKKCIKRLTNLGYEKFNYTVTALFRFASPKWMNATEIVKRLERKPSLLNGDVYATKT